MPTDPLRQQSAAEVCDAKIRAQGIPIYGVTGNQAPFVVSYDPAATQAQRDQGNAIAAQPAVAMQPRKLSDIYKDVQGLTTLQWNKVWADISAPVGTPPTGVPRKYLGDYGVNAGPIFCMDWSVYASGASGAPLLAGQRQLVALYVQDNNLYLVNPPFSPDINVPGNEPA